MEENKKETGLETQLLREGHRGYYVRKRRRKSNGTRRESQGKVKQSMLTAAQIVIAAILAIVIAYFILSRSASAPASASLNLKGSEVYRAV